MSNRKKTLNVLKCVFFLLYFVVLTVERIISLTAAFSTDLAETGTLNIYMTVIALISLVGGWLYLAVFARGLFMFARDKTGADFKHASIAAGIILVSGMVHTDGTIAPIQFAAYGCLIVAMIIFTAESVAAYGNAVVRWLTLAYIVAFSMAIPVVYPSNCTIHGCSLCAAFYPVECVTSIALVAAFTAMLVRFFHADSLLSFCPVMWGFAAIADGATLGLRWHDEINMFVLIFAALTVVLGIVGMIVSHFTTRKTPPQKDESAKENK